MLRAALIGVLLALVGCDTEVPIGNPIDAGASGGGNGGGGGGGGGAGAGGRAADAGPSDGGVDAGQADAGQADAGQADAGQADAGQADAGRADAGAPGETCQTAVRVASNSSSNFALASFSNDYGATSGCPGGMGPDAVYVVNVPAWHQLEAWVSIPDAGPFSLGTSLQLVLGPPAACDGL